MAPLPASPGGKGGMQMAATPDSIMRKRPGLGKPAVMPTDPMKPSMAPKPRGGGMTLPAPPMEARRYANMDPAMAAQRYAAFKAGQLPGQQMPPGAGVAQLTDAARAAKEGGAIGFAPPIDGGGIGKPDMTKPMFNEIQGPPPGQSPPVMAQPSPGMPMGQDPMGGQGGGMAPGGGMSLPPDVMQKIAALRSGPFGGGAPGGPMGAAQPAGPGGLPAIWAGPMGGQQPGGGVGLGALARPRMNAI